MRILPFLINFWGAMAPLLFRPHVDFRMFFTYVIITRTALFFPYYFLDGKKSKLVNTVYLYNPTIWTPFIIVLLSLYIYT